MKKPLDERIEEIMKQMLDEREAERKRIDAARQILVPSLDPAQKKLSDEIERHKEQDVVEKVQAANDTIPELMQNMYQQLSKLFVGEAASILDAIVKLDRAINELRYQNRNIEFAHTGLRKRLEYLERWRTIGQTGVAEMVRKELDKYTIEWAPDNPKDKRVIKIKKDNRERGKWMGPKKKSKQSPV